MTMHRLSPRILAVVVAMCLALSVYARPKTYRVVMQTTMGDIEIVLFNDTPRHRDNFVKLVREGYYDGLLFHRVIKDFMIQSGDPDSRQARPGQLLGEGYAAFSYEEMEHLLAVVREHIPAAQLRGQ